ncbi:MAG TPA: HNH endonuclease signature motif containing protein [Gammaproteobacteria bacterium]|nr:HNH endonuclease signature motif containing protein [Gammaproteobacteria bacterium]
MRITVTCAYCAEALQRYASKSRTYFCNTNHKALWQIARREAHGFTREWLISEYVEKCRSANEIALEIGRDATRVLEWLNDYGIRTRPRGHNHAQLAKDGSPFRGKSHTPETRARLREIALADGRVPFNRLVGPPMRGKRGAETINWKGGVTPERQAFYSSREWKDACRAVWARADAYCERCGLDSREVDLTIAPFHVHHITSFAVRELRSVLTNLALLCAPCHRFVHSRGNIDNELLRDAA